MQKIINKQRKKLKKERLCNKRLDNQVLEYHSDILILDQCNFKLEQENTELNKKIKEYEEIYLHDAKTLFDKRLQAIMIEVDNMKNDDNTFYKSALKYLCSYIQALEKYSKGDMKDILEKINDYKIRIKESQNSLYDINSNKKYLVKKLNHMSKNITEFKSKLENN